MIYLNADKLREIDVTGFRARKPYPWINPEEIITQQGYERLIATLPEPALFQAEFGVQRSHGQAPHDRLALEYREDLAVSREWHEFIQELRGTEYRRFMRAMYGTPLLSLTFHWHYTPTGCSVSPHCDAMRKLGSHIFYLNTERDWEPEWGGQTLVLDDGGRFERKSAPKFEDFDAEIAAEGIGNRSFLFARLERSWHGVREIRCPEGRYRKVFIVVVEDKKRSLVHSIIDPLRGKKRARY